MGTSITTFPATQSSFFPGISVSTDTIAHLNAGVQALTDIEAAIKAGAISGFDASLTTVLATGSTLPRTSADRAADFVNIRDFGAKGDRTTDDTAAINAAYAVIGARGGGHVVWPLGGYKVSAPIVCFSNTKTEFLPGSVVLPVPSGSFTVLGGDPSALGQVRALFVNANYNASVLTDSNIEFDGPVLMQGGLFDGHGIIMRMVSNVAIRRARSDRLQSTTAMVACRTTLVTACVTTNCNNAAHDHWDGTQDYTVRDCQVNGSQWGILSSAANSDGSMGRANSSGLFDGNRVYNCSQAAILANCLNADGNQSNLRILSNYVDQAGTPPRGSSYFNGIQIIGAASGDIIDGNQVQNCLGTPIAIQPETVGGVTISPSFCRISSNTLEQCSPPAALIVAVGSHHNVSKNAMIQGAAAIGIQLTDPTSVAEDNDLPGAAVHQVDQTQAGAATQPALLARADPTVGWAFTGQPMTVDALKIGASSPTAITAGNGAPTTSTAPGLYFRKDGSPGARLYVSQGAGAWSPISGV